MTTLQILGHISYDEWIMNNPKVLEQEEDCPDCNGTGVTECDSCGSDIDCETCSGRGLINDSHDLYTEQCARDKRKFTDFLRRLQNDKLASSHGDI